MSGALAAALERAEAHGTRVTVALSGGIDSVVLLHALHALAADCELELAALHVNHGLSPQAYAWERHCRALCKRLGVPLAVRRVRLAARREKGLEAAARAARYAVLAAAQADIVALAHQLDDQAETVLLNLLRGAGLRGAAAMAEFGPLPESDEGAPRALRPMLSVPRATVLAYALAHQLEWVEDESNADENLTRNWLRRRVGPLLAGRFPRWRESLARAAAHFAEAQAALGEGGERLTVGALQRVPQARAKLLLRDFLRAHGLRAPSVRRLEEMLRQIKAAPQDALVALEHDGATLRRFRGELAVLSQAAPPGEILFHSCQGAGIDAAKLKAGPLTIRARQGGERLRLAARRPSRTLKNLFQEAGIPPWERDRLPLLFCGDTLVWVPGLGIDAAFRAAGERAGLLPEWRRMPAD